MNRQITICGPRQGLGQYVEAATAAYGAYSSSKGGGGQTHEERVAARGERVAARQQALGVTPAQWAQLSQMARAKGYTFKTHKGIAVETIVQELGGIDAVRARFGWEPAAAPGGGIVAAGFGGGGSIPWLMIAILGGILIVPKLLKAK